MPNFNCVILAGHLTRDCETRTANSGTAITKTGLAVNGWKQGDVCFIDLVAFNKTGEALGKVKKGQAVQIRGRLQLETWDDKNGGGKRSKHSVTVDEVIYLGGGGKATNAERVANEGIDRQEQVAAETQGDGEIPF